MKKSFFVTHIFHPSIHRRWSAGRWQKMVALLYFFNLPTALVCAAVATYVGIVAALTVDDAVLSKIPGFIQPEFPSMIDGTVSQFYQPGEMLVPLVFVPTLLTAHWWTGKQVITVFLDMCWTEIKGFMENGLNRRRKYKGVL